MLDENENRGYTRMRRHWDLSKSSDLEYIFLNGQMHGKI